MGCDSKKSRERCLINMYNINYKHLRSLIIIICIRFMMAIGYRSGVMRSSLDTGTTFRYSYKAHTIKFHEMRK